MKGFIATILVIALGLMACENDSQQQLEAQKIAEKNEIHVKYSEKKEEIKKEVWKEKGFNSDKRKLERKDLSTSPQLGHLCISPSYFILRLALTCLASVATPHSGQNLESGVNLAPQFEQNGIYPHLCIKIILSLFLILSFYPNISVEQLKMLDH